MAPSNFIDYPVPTEGPAAQYGSPPLNNPVLRGLPLTIAANLIARVPFLQRLIWSNGGFGVVKDLPDLDEMDFRFHPAVTPLGDQEMLDLEPELLQTRDLSSQRYYSVADYHEMYKSKKTTPLQVAEALLRLSKNGPYADAWADTYGKDHLALEAARASTKRYAEGKPLSVLDGVPVGIKDDTDVKGYVSHTGMKYKEGIPTFKPAEETIWCIQMLQGAGAVIIGKNVMHELGSDTNGLNPLQGTPTNHYNKDYYPGGSTSGGASATGAGVVPITIGSDAGGSIRVPASYNGVYGLKPTHHRTGYYNLTNCVRGPLAATASDLTIAYRLMSRPNPDDPVQCHFGTSQLPEKGAKRVIGIYKDWWSDAAPEVRQICEKAVDYFKNQLGYEVIDISIPLISEGRVAHSICCVAELTERARRKDPNDPSGWMNLVGAANKLLLAASSQCGAGDYLKANALRELLMRHLAFLWQKHPGLLIVTPTVAIKGWQRHPGDEAHGSSDTNMTVQSMSYIFLSNFTGAPSVTAPVGYSRPDIGEGQLPVGLLAMGEWGQEEQLLQWAREAEEYLEGVYEGGRRRPETWVDVFAEAQKQT